METHKSYFLFLAQERIRSHVAAFAIGRDRGDGLKNLGREETRSPFTGGMAESAGLVTEQTCAKPPEKTVT